MCTYNYLVYGCIHPKVLTGVEPCVNRGGGHLTIIAQDSFLEKCIKCLNAERLKKQQADKLQKQQASRRA
jgi:hypothetical protein